MHTRIFVAIITLISGSLAKAQDLIVVTEQTLQLQKSEELYFAFEDGDEIVFNFQTVDEKPINEVIVSQYPDDVKFSDYKMALIQDKKLKVNGKNIYKFEFKNPKKTICKIKIERKPKDASTENFNTAVQWVEKMDTIFSVKTKEVVVRHENYEVSKTRRVLDKVDTSIVEVLSRTERVHSTTNLSNANSNQFHFTLPANTYHPTPVLPMVSEETVVWAYSISVGDNGKKWYESANKTAVVGKAASTIATLAGYSTGVGALATLAVQGYSVFASPPSGDNIKFSIFSASNNLISSGNSVAAAGRVSNSNQGVHYFRLENDNLMNGINVMINVVAVRVKKTWRNEPYTETKQRKITEKQVVKTPQKVEMRKVPVFLN